MRMVSVAAFCIVSFALAHLEAADDWPQWRGPQRNGLVPSGPALIDALPDGGLKPAWMVRDLPNLKSGGWSSPSVFEGRVYVFTHKRFSRTDAKKPGRTQFPYLPPEKRTGMTDEEYAEYEKNRRDEQEARAKAFRFDESLYCLDSETGERIWTNQRTSAYTRFPQSGSPTIAGGRIYVLGAGRIARCIGLDGKDIWSSQLEGEFRDEHLQSSFAVIGQVAVVKCGQLFALDVDSGKVLWSAGDAKSGAVHSSPTVWRSGDEAVVIANLDGKNTVGLRAKDGEELWRVRSDAGHSSPLISGEKLITYGSSRKRGLKCFDLSSTPPKMEWVFQGAADPGSSPVVLGDSVFVQGDRRLASVDLKTGKAKWSANLDLNRPRYTSLIAADDKVFYAFDGLLCFDATSRRFKPLMQAVVNRDGLLAEQDWFRRTLKIDEFERTAEGQKEAEVIWRKEISRSGPLPCSTPAIAGGRMYIRLQTGIACYDLRAK